MKSSVTDQFFHCHAHSKYSWLDGMGTVEQMVALASQWKQPAMALTDHGVMSGNLELYQATQKAGMACFPGLESYVTETLDKDADRYHVTLLALDFDGYKGLVKLSSMSFQKDHFYRKPRISLDELLDFGHFFGSHIAMLTGCHFGMLMQTLPNMKAASELLDLYTESFPNLYVELQQHDIVHPDGHTDLENARQVFGLAVAHGLPVIVTQDSHYCEKPHKPTHEMMKKLGYHTSDENEILFPGNSYHLASTLWVRKQWLKEPDVWREAQHGFADLLAKNKLSLPALDNYKFRVPSTGTTADAWLKRKATTGLHNKGLDVWVHYEQRLKSEIKTICDMGFADYFVLIEDMTSWCRKNKIMFNTRGSANGSLVCYALGITNVDPIFWKISFDRFLHPSRKKPPDIDMDVDRDRRAEVIQYVENKLTVTPIGTFSTLSETGDRGSLFVKYISYVRRVLGEEFKTSKYASINTLWDLERINPDDTYILRDLAQIDVYTGPGTHAAGYVLSSPDYPLDDYVPTMLVGGQKGNTVTQMTMHGVEAAGFVKVDLLGMAALTTVSSCLQMIGADSFEQLEKAGKYKLDDPDVCKMMSTGVTGSGIFQYDGYSTAKGARQMKIKSTKDAILCLALFRPAALKSGHTDEYLMFRKKIRQPVYLHSIFERNTKDTFGVFVLQDQVISVLRDLGMSFEDLNDMLTAVKASNTWIADAEKTFARLEPVFLRLCVSAGMTPDQARAGWLKVLDFSDYGFNLAHATSYGLQGYQMAWLKTYHPAQFMTALLQTWAGVPVKEPLYTAEARRMGLVMRRASVQHSGINWILDPDKKGIRKGLLSVKGIGLGTAEKIVTEREIKPFESLADLQKRCGKRVFTAMTEAQATGDLK